MNKLSGYMHPQYAYSLREFGEPRELKHCGGWILVRAIPGTTYKDATGCYPLFACHDWTKIQEDLESIGSDLVSLVLVTDPFSEISTAYLEQYFDFAKSFKTHYLVDFNQGLENFVHKGHRRNALKALKEIEVEVCCRPSQYLVDWIRLYENLISKHNIKGIKAFSPECFKIQLNLPGMVMFLGRWKGEIVGATLILIDEQLAYSHLSAYSNKGYKLRASYGIYWKALVYLHQHGIRYFHLGATTGIRDDPTTGLNQFKKGWSNDRCSVYFCGRIFDRKKYDAICQQYQIANTDYFPAYRRGEFH